MGCSASKLGTLDEPTVAATAVLQVSGIELSFDEVHDAVCDELEAHPEVWVRESKEMGLVVERFKALEGSVPMMHLIHGLAIEKLDRLPRSDELDDEGKPYWRTLEDLHAAWKPHPFENDPTREYKKLNVVFLSHRWSKPTLGLPDDDDNTKASIVVKQSKYGRDTYETDNWWWVDWVCANQNNTAGHIAALPLYIAASTECFSVYIPGGDYDRRGWIRCERALSASLNSPRSWKMIPPKVFAECTAKGEPPEKSEWWTLEDPFGGEATVEGDRIYLARLSALALKMWPVGYACNWKGDNKYAEWGYQSELVYGETKIYTWCMNYFAGI
ncbi:hypothetical protein T492DRAFT_1141243 [Pavlovales sp. CCMP2436]|nr:hypothetical protein T492DRAFT_1141243 [Pavlovales sp. CCMP2436]